MTEPITKPNTNKEIAILALIMRDPGLINSAMLKPHHFQNSDARHIYNVMAEIKKRADLNTPKGIAKYDFSGVTIRTVAETGKFPFDDDLFGLLVDNYQNEAEYNLNHFENYCASVRNAGVVAQLMNVAEGIKEMAAKHDIEKDVKGILRTAENQILELEDCVTSNDEPILAFSEDLLEEDIDHYQAIADDGEGAGIHVGFKCIDEGMLGLRPGTLTVIGARAKVGKSAFALNIALNTAKYYNGELPILYLDTEMSGREQRARALSIEANVNEKKIVGGNLTSDEKIQVKNAIKRLAGYPIYHLYIRDFAPETVLNIVRRMYNTHGIKFLIYDYIKLPPESDLRAAQEYQLLGYLADMLKNRVAGAMNIPVLTFCQLNRDGIKQMQEGAADESSVGGSDRIIHYCSTYGVLRRANEKELADPDNKGGKQGNRKLHILVSRHGGESTEPITIRYATDDGIPSMIEVGEWMKQDHDNRQERTGKAGKLADAGDTEFVGDDESPVDEKLHTEHVSSS